MFRHSDSVDLPEILQAKLLERFTKILQHAQVLQTNHLDVLKSRLVSVESALSEINIVGDQSLFIDYNIRPFTAPNDWKFEPCATFYDTASLFLGVYILLIWHGVQDELNTDPAPKVFLQNKLTRGRIKLQELGPLMETKRIWCSSCSVFSAHANSREGC